MIRPSGCLLLFFFVSESSHRVTPFVPQRSFCSSSWRGRQRFAAKKGDTGNKATGRGRSSSSSNKKRRRSSDETSPKKQRIYPKSQRAAEELLDYSIDSFLRGEYDRPFAEEAPAPLPGLTPGATIEAALHALRQMDDPEPAHGAAVLLRFCAPLSRGERWSGVEDDPWKELIRGALTPTMLGQRMRASKDFSDLLEWSRLDVTDGALGSMDPVGIPSMAFVNAALYFDLDDEGPGEQDSRSTGTAIAEAVVIPPTLVQFKLTRRGGVWLIESATKKEIQKLFLRADDDETDDDDQLKGTRK